MRPPYSYRNDSNVPVFSDNTPIAVMDGECALCSWGARMIHRLDQSGRVRICPVQSPLGRALLKHYGLRAEDPTSWLYLDAGQAYMDFEGMIHAGRSFGGWGHLVVALRLFPRPVRNWLYRRLARNRYMLFGKGDICALPDPEFRKRLIE
jgi:predicted DCC family thiol-disulfide oxidoreductase YuxK